MINLVILGGRLTRDPDLRYTASGAPVISFSIANNRAWISDGEKKTSVSFISVSAFGKTAENISKYFKKGNPILVEGWIKNEQWEKDGERKSKTSVVVMKFHFCGGKKQETSDEQFEKETSGEQKPEEEISWEE